MTGFHLLQLHIFDPATVTQVCCRFTKVKVKLVFFNNVKLGLLVTSTFYLASSKSTATALIQLTEYILDHLEDGCICTSLL